MAGREPYVFHMRDGETVARNLSRMVEEFTAWANAQPDAPFCPFCGYVHADSAECLPLH